MLGAVRVRPLSNWSGSDDEVRNRRDCDLRVSSSQTGWPKCGFGFPCGAFAVLARVKGSTLPVRPAGPVRERLRRHRRPEPGRDQQHHHRRGHSCCSKFGIRRSCSSRQLRIHRFSRHVLHDGGRDDRNRPTHQPVPRRRFCYSSRGTFLTWSPISSAA